MSNNVHLTCDLIRDATGDTNEYVIAVGVVPTYGLSTIIAPPETDNAEQANFQPASNTFGVWEYGGNSYKLVSKQFAHFATSVYKSTDGDVTWAELDAGGAPTLPNGTGYFDGDHTVTVAFIDAFGTSGPIAFKDFNLITETWGLQYGGSAPTSRAVASVWKRPDGSIVVFVEGRYLPFTAGDGTSGLLCAVFAAGAWTSFDPGASITSLTGWDPAQTRSLVQRSTTYMEESGRIGLFWTTSSLQFTPEIWGNRIFFQQINTDNSLGSFFDFPGQSVATSGHQDMEAFSGTPLGTPVVLPDQDIIAVPMLFYNRVDGFPNVPRVYIGAPISAPVWSVDATKSMDPDADIASFYAPQSWGSLTFDGVNLYACTSGMNFVDPFVGNLVMLRVMQTSNLAAPDSSWTAVTALTVADLPSALQVSGQALVVPAIQYTLSAVEFRNQFD